MLQILYSTLSHLAAYVCHRWSRPGPVTFMTHVGMSCRGSITSVPQNIDDRPPRHPSQMFTGVPHTTIPMFTPAFRHQFTFTIDRGLHRHTSTECANVKTMLVYKGRSQHHGYEHCIQGQLGPGPRGLEPYCANHGATRHAENGDYRAKPGKREGKLKFLGE